MLNSTIVDPSLSQGSTHPTGFRRRRAGPSTSRSSLYKFTKNDRINKPFDVFSQALVTLGAKKESVETIQSFIKTKHKNPILAYEELFRITGVQYIKENENIKITGL